MSPVAAGSRGDDLGRAAALEGAAGDAEGGHGRAEPAVVRVADGPLDQERLGRRGGTGRPAPEEPAGCGSRPGTWLRISPRRPAADLPCLRRPERIGNLRAQGSANPPDPAQGGPRRSRTRKMPWPRARHGTDSCHQRFRRARTDVRSLLQAIIQRDEVT